MIKSKKLVLSIVILAIFLAFYNLIELILSIHNLTFRHTVFYPFIAIAAVLSLLCIIQIIRILYSIVKNRKFKLFLRVLAGTATVIVSFLLLISLLLAPVYFAVWHHPEHVVEKDGKKMVAYVDSYLQITVYYYDYKNVFIRGKQLKVMVDGGNGGSDPYENGQGPQVYRYTYYDDNGNILDSNWAGK